MARFNPISLVAGIAFGFGIVATVVNKSQGDQIKTQSARIKALEEKFEPDPAELVQAPSAPPKVGEIFEKRFARRTVRELTVLESPAFKRGDRCALSWDGTYVVHVLEVKEDLVLVSYADTSGRPTDPGDCVDGTVGVITVEYFDTFRANLENDELYGPEELAEARRILAAFPEAAP